MPVTFTSTSDAAPSPVAAAAVLRDWALDPVTGDLMVDPVTGDSVELSGVDAIVSDLKSRFLAFLGEWFLDITIGFAWFVLVLGQKLDEGAVRNAVEAEALGCPGVVSVDATTLVFDGTTRTLTITFSATTDVGAVITATLQVQQGAT